MGVLNEIDSQSLGIIPQSIQQILSYLEREEAQRKLISWQVNVSLFEIYQDGIRDLLNPDEGQNLNIREEADGEIYVESLTEVPIKSLD